MKKRLMILVMAVMFMTAFKSAPVYAGSDKIEKQSEEDLIVTAMEAGRTEAVTGSAISAGNTAGGRTEAKKEEQKKEEQKKDAEKKAKKAEKKVEKKKNYTEADVKLLACLIYTEAGNQSYKGKLAVANVVLDRVKSNLFPNTMKGVIYQNAYSRAYGRTIYQFSVASPSVGTLKKALNSYGRRTNAAEIRMEQECIKVAKAALEGKRAFEGKNYLFFCRYTSSLAYRKPNGQKLEAHYFYR